MTDVIIGYIPPEDKLDEWIGKPSAVSKKKTTARKPRASKKTVKPSTNDEGACDE